MCSFIHLKHHVFIQIKYFKTFKRKVNLTVGGRAVIRQRAARWQRYTLKHIHEIILPYLSSEITLLSAV